MSTLQKLLYAGALGGFAYLWLQATPPSRPSIEQQLDARTHQRRVQYMNRQHEIYGERKPLER